ncbi:MAG: ketopantoate reductase family protein [Gemmatimonadota bacterium]
MKFVVLGAGGLGGYLGAALLRAGHDVQLVTRGQHLEVIRRDGLHVREPTGGYLVRIPCAASGLDVERPDVVLVTVKTYALDGVAPQVHYLAEQGALVVPLLNGVDAVERLEAMGVRSDRLLAGLAYVTAFRTGPGVIERKGEHGRIVLSPPGPVGGAASATLVTPIARALESAGLVVEVSSDIRMELWRKMAVVCTLAALCGPSGSTLGPLRAHPAGDRLQRAAVAEVLQVARALGVPLDSEEESRVAAVLDAFPDGFYPSLLHDLATGIPTEIDALNGTVSRLGRVHEVPTPVHDLTTVAIQLREARGR